MTETPAPLCRASFNYHDLPPDGSEPVIYANVKGSGEAPKPTNMPQVKVMSPIYDMRELQKRETLDLDVHGFVVVPAGDVTMADDEWVEKNVPDMYAPKLLELVKRVTGCENVYTAASSTSFRASNVIPGQVITPPAFKVHVDFTPDAAWTFATLCLAAYSGKSKEEQEELRKGRIRLLNVWRPIRHPVYDVPLAVVDRRTFDPKEDLIAARIGGHEKEETAGNVYYTMAVKHNENHKWYSLSEHHHDEILIFKGFDTASSDVSSQYGVPHSAFEHPDYFGRLEELGLPPRESIEMRVVVFG